MRMSARRGARRLAAVFASAAAWVLLVAGGVPAEALVNGTPTSISQHPYMVSLRQNNQHFCNGALVSPTAVVTAAHCLVDHQGDINSLAAVTGATMLNSGGVSHRIGRIVVHPNYGANEAGFDIALAILDRPVQSNAETQAIRLPTSELYSGERVTVSAWGSTGFRQQMHSDLRQITAGVMDAAVCQQYHQGFMRIHRNEFCTLVASGTGTCNGDSGAPWAREGDRTLAGVVSRGRPCALGYPDVQTSVYPYVSWIRSYVPL